MIKLTLTLLLLTFSFSILFGQTDYREGYIVTISGDTLKGEVNFKGGIKSGQECKFKASLSSEVKIFKPDQISGYGFNNGKIFESKPVLVKKRILNYADRIEEIPVPQQGEINFMQVLVKGKSSLYYLLDVNSEKHFYMQTEDERLKELVYFEVMRIDPKTTSKYLYQLRAFEIELKEAFKDCPGLDNAIEKVSFNQSKLSDLFENYNNCIKPDQAVYREKKSENKITWGVLAGLSFSDLAITAKDHYLAKGDYDSKPAFSTGLFFDFTIPGINPKLSVNNAVSYTQRKYYADYLYAPNELYIANYKINYNFQLARLETTIRYTAPSKKIFPFGQIGISNGFLIGASEEINWTKFYLNYPPEERSEADLLTPTFKEYQVGFVAGTGIKYPFKSGSLLSLQLNYEFNTGFSNAVSFGTRSHNYAILVGYGF